MRTAVREVTELPQATNYLNYPQRGPAVGTYLGPNDDGEYFTVVNSEVRRPKPGVDASHRVRVGLAYGCLMIDGEPTDPEGLPPEVALQRYRNPWVAFENPAAVDVRPLVAMKEAIKRVR